MKIKKKLLVLIAIVTVITGLSSIANANGGIAPKPIRDSIVEEF